MITLQNFEDGVAHSDASVLRLAQRYLINDTEAHSDEFPTVHALKLTPKYYLAHQLIRDYMNEHKLDGVSTCSDNLQ